MDNKGFTLIELIVTIVVLALITSIGTYSITQILKGAKDKDYELLITNIKSGAELYYQECKYAYTGSITCPTAKNVNGIDYYETTLSNLVKYGFVEANNTDNATLVNTKDNKSIMNCKIKYSYANGKITVTAVSPTGSCPTSY